jgi:ABC-type phosphate transport system substrate-binding protein
MQKKLNKSFQVALLVVAALTARSASAEVAVVVSSKSSATALTADQASDIFLGKSNALPGAGQAVPIDQAETSTVREEFYHKSSGKNLVQVKAYWSKQIFAGKGQPPKDVGDNASVKNLVTTNPNMIGYIDKSAIDGTVKVLLTLK